MSDNLVKKICIAWIEDGLAEDCFWEGWPECPTPEEILTPRMVLDRIEELEKALQETCQREAATIARYDARIEELEGALARTEANRDAAMQDAQEEYQRTEALAAQEKTDE